MARKKNLEPVYLPPPADTKVRAAIRRLARGEATKDQQMLALNWIITRAAYTYDFHFRPSEDGGERDTAFALGRAFVGQQIVKIINMPGSVHDAMRTNAERG